jgi:ankyrin repeat protein
MPKKEISAKEILKDVRAGVPDSYLWEKYRVSPENLQYILERLVKAGLLSYMELYDRTALDDAEFSSEFENPDEYDTVCGYCGKTLESPLGDECPYCQGKIEGSLVANIENSVLDFVTADPEDVTLKVRETQILSISWPQTGDSSEISTVEIESLHQDLPQLDETPTDGTICSTVDSRKIAQLLRVAGKGNLNSVKSLVSRGVSINCSGKEGNTALIWAAFKGQDQTARFLVEKGADIETQNAQGNTALIAATSGGHSEIVSILLRHGANANHRNVDGNTALTVAAANSSTRIVSALLNHKADPNLLNNYGDTPLMRACVSGARDVVKLILESGAITDIGNKFGNTALMKAAFKGNQEILKMLIKAGADVNIKNRYGNTALMKASFANQSDAVKLLLKCGADIDAADNGGNTALTRARQAGLQNIIKLLLKHNAKTANRSN